MPYSPHDLLPIRNPKDEQPDSTFFYERVVKHLVPDIIRMEGNGIPINLERVAELEETVSKVIEEVHRKLKNNPIMLAFLETISSVNKKKKIEELEQKRRELESFLKSFDIKNKTHRSYVVNAYLVQNHPDKFMPEWSVKDLKILSQVTASKFISNILDKKMESWMQEYIDQGMRNLAEDQCLAYNKNRVEIKQESVNNSNLINLFNPGSALQKQKFFAYYGIESENETDAGNPKWDRDELERIQKLLKLLIEDKEND